MNNAKLTLEQFTLNQGEEDQKRAAFRQDREVTLRRMVETLRRVAASDDWSSLKNLLWHDVVETLERQQQSEAESDKPDPLKLAKINGQLVWARKYSDLNKIADLFAAELHNLRQQK